MEVVASPDQTARWLAPLMEGRTILLRHDRTGAQGAAIAFVMAKIAAWGKARATRARPQSEALNSAACCDPNVEKDGCLRKPTQTGQLIGARGAIALP